MTIEQTISCVTCLISGVIVFNIDYPEPIRRNRVVKGFHGFHLYAHEYWTDHVITTFKVYERLDHFPLLDRLLAAVSQQLQLFTTISPGELRWTVPV